MYNSVYMFVCMHVCDSVCNSVLCAYVQLQMRHVFIILDLSRAMELQDLRPNRLKCTVKVINCYGDRRGL